MSKQNQINAVMPEVLNAFQRRECVHVEPEEIAVHVKQEFKKESDINEIMRKAQNGVYPPAWMTSKTPYYGDFTNQPQSLMEAHDVISRAQEAFMSLPLDMRRELDHDFRRIDSAPREMYEKYGLLKRPDESADLSADDPAATRGQTGGSPPRKSAVGAQDRSRKADQSKVDPDGSSDKN